MESSVLSCATDLLFLSHLCGHSEHAELFQPSIVALPHQVHLNPSGLSPWALVVPVTQCS